MKTNLHFSLYYRTVLLGMRSVSGKSCRGDQNTRFTFNKVFFFPRKSCRLWDNVKKSIVELCRPQMTIWRMRITCWILNATNSHSGCLMFDGFSTATVVVWTHLSVTLCLYCPSCWYCSQLWNYCRISVNYNQQDATFSRFL